MRRRMVDCIRGEVKCRRGRLCGTHVALTRTHALPTVPCEEREEAVVENITNMLSASAGRSVC
jgi:hypothetical protein